MTTRRSIFIACIGLWAIHNNSSAATTQVYSDDFEDGRTIDARTEWSFNSTNLGTAAIERTNPTGAGLDPTHFLGEFGGDDKIQLKLDLGLAPLTVSLSFDAYFLRTWDGNDARFGNDMFGFDYNTTHLLHAGFSNGFGKQTFCPGTTSPCEAATGSDPKQFNRLGFTVQLKPVPGIDSPAIGTPMSMVYHFDTGPVSYQGGLTTFTFFSNNLQVHPGLQLVDGGPIVPVIDESWGVDNVKVFVSPAIVPEPTTVAMMLTGLLTLVMSRRFSGRRG
ncbi:MAG: PEP-CTERM sorting domain-containing protein [Betaproteobacteria bacterium]